MNHENKETPGAGTPKVTVDLPGDRYYAVKDANELLKSVSRGTRIDARSRVAEAEAALNEARLKAREAQGAVTPRAVTVPISEYGKGSYKLRKLVETLAAYDPHLHSVNLLLE